MLDRFIPFALVAFVVGLAFNGWVRQVGEGASRGVASVPAFEKKDLPGVWNAEFRPRAKFAD